MNDTLVRTIMTGSVFITILVLYWNYGERKKNEEVRRLTRDLEESKKRYYLLFQNVVEAIVILQEGKIKLVNPKALEITGYSTEELEEISFVSLIYPEDVADTLNFHEGRLAGQNDNRKYQFRMLKKGGALRWVESDGIQIVWNNKPATLNFVVDITQRKRMQEEIQYKASFQKLIASISQDFIHTTAYNIDETIEKIIQKAGKFFDADRSYLYQYELDSSQYSTIYEWCREPGCSVVKDIKEEFLDQYRWWKEQLSHNEVIYLFDIDQLPEEALKEREEFQRQQIQSLLCIPISIDDQSKGYLRFDFFHEKRHLTTENMGLLVIVANTLTDGLRKNKIEKKLLLTKEQLELAFFQAQIKPHFLYNTLTTIGVLCETDPSLASRLILDLSVYLRRSFDFKKFNKYILLEKELELIQVYVNIEKARFDNRLEVIYDIKTDSRNILIPPLIIQPLVENSICHGLMKRIEGGILQIRVIASKNYCEIQIKDNGLGMSQALLEKLLKEENDREFSEEKDQRTGVGLRNIHMRLKKIYGSGLKIKSRINEGTCISFSIPIDQKEVDEDDKSFCSR